MSHSQDESQNQPEQSSNRPPGSRGGVLRPGRRRVVGVAGAVVVLGGAAALWEGSRRRDHGSDARAAADGVARAWSSGKWVDAGFVAADARTPIPADLAAEYARLVGGLARLAPVVRVTSMDLDSLGDGNALARLAVAFDLAAGHGAAPGSEFAYATTLRLRREGDGDPQWRALWEPVLVHPSLTAGATLVLERSQPQRADVLGRDGRPVVTDTPVVQVGVQPSRTTDPAGTAAALGAALGVDATGLTTRIQQAAPDAFVEVITLRRSDYDAQRDVLQPLPGTVFRESTLPLAPTRGFARALLGGVGQATAEVIEGSRGRYAVGDVAGISGIQQRYDERLAGRVGIVVRAEGGADAVSKELLNVAAVPGETVRTSLVVQVQEAADDTLTGTTEAALVALDVRTGEVLAVANSPVDGGDRALTGRFEPGSTFKVVTTLALLALGLDPEQTVACTPTYTIEGRTISNFEDEAFGDVSFRTDFARSCNTAFASLSPRLADDALPRAAAQLGVGTAWSTGVDTFAGDVPAAESAVDLAVASFGQGRTLVSPLAMAVAAASVAAGKVVSPAIVLEPAPETVATTSVSTPPADPALLTTLGGLMREVVTAGTGNALLGVPGEPVHAKTGTAEYGSSDPLPTHAWLIGYQGSMAVAVFVADGVSGGAVAAPLAADFLRRVAATGVG
ncbi:MAG: penicillin-binding transpeptidase domain-containing protein [Janthinobacterium lividum]